MRVVTVIGVLLAGGAATLTAQHAHQLEFGGFTSWTRYDRAFGLNNTFDSWKSLGFGGRIGYFLSDYVGLEVDANVATPTYKATGDTTTAVLGSASLIINSGTGGKVLYVLGGGGGYKAPAPPEIPKAKRDSIVAAGGKLPEAAPAAPRGGPTYETRTSDWAHKWYWGAQGGLFVFRTNFDSYSFEPTFGGHWLITGKKTALYVAFEQSFFLSARHATILEPNQNVELGNISFNNARRIMVGVLAFPAQLRVEPYGGGGFMIVELLNPTVEKCTGCTLSELGQLQDEADNAASKAFFWWMGGVDIKQGRLALYGHYILTSSAANFLIQGTTHTFQGGIRYSLGGAKEGDSDRQ